MGIPLDEEEDIYQKIQDRFKSIEPREILNAKALRTGEVLELSTPYLP